MGKCYRKSDEHRKEFAHPGDDDWSQTSTSHNDTDVISGCQNSTIATSTLVQIRLVGDDLVSLEKAKAELTKSGFLEHYMAQADVDAIAVGAGEVCYDWDAPPLADRDDERVDPEDGRLWTWDSYQSHYKD